MKKFIKYLASLMGFELKRVGNVKNSAAINQSSMKEGLKRCLKRGSMPRTIIDVGAAQGKWSISAKKIWPNASYLLFEPLLERKKELDLLAALNQEFHIVPSAVGKEKGKLQFYIANDLDGSGIAEDKKHSENVRYVDVTTLDDEIKNYGFEGPYLIKLDTHGFELPILEGCQAILSNVELFIIECYGFKIASNSLLFWQMCEYMEKLGFRLVDIVDVMNRPTDGSFWQCDAFFARNDNVVFHNNQYN